MKTTKKLAVLGLAAVLAAVSFIPSTFSWYTRESTEGRKFNYNNANLPISIKSAADTITMSTYISDANGNATTTAVNAIDVAPGEIKYYKTTFTNSGSNDIYLDFGTSNLGNDADFIIGTVSPTLNEKAYASRPERTKVTSSYVRVYFKTYSGFLSYWGTDSGSLDTTHDVGNENTTSNDINIAYTVNGTETMAMMKKCPTESASDASGTTKVYYFDLPSNTTSYYFFNHWYLCSASNREWNRTIDISDLTAGKLYYLNGSKVDEKYKAYTAKPVDTELVALNSYYNYVRMSQGTSVFADIGLKKSSDDPDFVPEYYGKSISYSSSDTSVAKVNGDGIITPVSGGTAIITTTITGRYDDTTSKETDVLKIKTTVDIPSSISQVPIITNVKVPARANEQNGEVEIDWYALNKSNKSDKRMTTSGLFYTI